MPRGLRGGFLTVLYALGAMADTTGRLRFARDGKAIRISDIAAAAGCDQKDARRYLLAAEAAGVVSVEGERKRGRPSLYVILVSPVPDWGAAVSSLGSSRRKPRQAPPWLEGDQEKNGGESPELFEPKNGGHTPELSALDHKKERGTHPLWSSGDSPPNGSGDSPPNNPGITHELPHEMADVRTDPQVVVATAPKDIDATHEDDPNAEPEPDPVGVVRCAICHERMIARPGRAAHSHCLTNQKPA